MVARLRISRDANCGKSSARSGMRPSRNDSTSERETAAPISTNSSPNVSVRNSGS